MASTSVVTNPSQNVPIFTGVNYQFWRIKMRTIFLSYDLWELVENGFDDFPKVERLSTAQRNELREKQKKDAKALVLIQEALDDVIFPKIMGQRRKKREIYLKKSIKAQANM